LTNLRSAVPQITVINARERPELVAHYKSNGIDLNDGMVIKIGDLLLSGAPAFALINKLSKPDSQLTKFALRVLSGRNSSRFMYPVLAAGRRILLLILGRKLL
jgi:hypothetical protein